MFDKSPLFHEIGSNKNIESKRTLIYLNINVLILLNHIILTYSLYESDQSTAFSINVILCACIFNSIQFNLVYTYSWHTVKMKSNDRKNIYFNTKVIACRSIFLYLNFEISGTVFSAKSIYRGRHIHVLSTSIIEIKDYHTKDSKVQNVFCFRLNIA